MRNEPVCVESLSGDFPGSSALDRASHPEPKCRLSVSATAQMAAKPTAAPKMRRQGVMIERRSLVIGHIVWTFSGLSRSAKLLRRPFDVFEGTTGTGGGAEHHRAAGLAPLLRIATLSISRFWVGLNVCAQAPLIPLLSQFFHDFRMVGRNVCKLCTIIVH